MPVCPRCGKNKFRVSFGPTGKCLQCEVDLEHEEKALAADARQREREVSAAQMAAECEAILLTTETAHDLKIERRLGIITSEVVIGMHLFRDALATVTDTFGGRSGTMQDGLRKARILALQELRQEARELGAEAVVAVDLDYSEISGGGKNMLLLVASGTAVTLAQDA